MSLLRQIWSAIWQIPIAVNGEILKNNLVTLVVVSEGNKSFIVLIPGPSFLMLSLKPLFIPFFFFLPRLVTRQYTISTMKGPMVVAAEEAAAAAVVVVDQNVFTFVTTLTFTLPHTFSLLTGICRN